MECALRGRITASGLRAVNYLSPEYFCRICESKLTSAAGRRFLRDLSDFIVVRRIIGGGSDKLSRIVGFVLGNLNQYSASRHRIAIKAQRGKRSEEHTSELQSLTNLVCRLLLEKKKAVRAAYIGTRNQQTGHLVLHERPDVAAARRGLNQL